MECFALFAHEPPCDGSCQMERDVAFCAVVHVNVDVLKIRFQSRSETRAEKQQVLTLVCNRSSKIRDGQISRLLEKMGFVAVFKTGFQLIHFTSVSTVALI